MHVEWMTSLLLLVFLRDRMGYNPFTAGPEYIRFFHFFISKIRYHILNMLKINCDINQ